MNRSRTLYRGSWGIVAYTVLIIIWGAWVRYSGSGDGCGDHWPLCNGDVLPQAAATKTWIEFSHRISTGVYGVLVALQIALTRRAFSKGHPSRFWSWMTLLFTSTEALIGRQLVKSGLVNESHDLARMFVMPLHLVNTSLLLFSGVMTAQSIRYGARDRARMSPGTQRNAIIAAVALTTILATGAIAALGSHLSPSASLLSGLSQDLSGAAHPAVKLRVLHPIAALLIGAMVFLSVSSAQGSPMTPFALWRTRFLYCLATALCIGVATIVLLSPLWLKTLHLLMTNILVIVFSVCVFHALRPHNAPDATENIK